MQSSCNELELLCSVCDIKFKSAASLLQHFAMHASESMGGSHDTVESKPKKPNIPDLYPINRRDRHNTSESPKTDEKEENGDSGIEDLFNPLKYCLVTLDEATTEKITENTEGTNKHPTTRKYECQYCFRNFGWSTDLKRHILTHTGEKPFHCHQCNCRFTRNFLLQKHQMKQHPEWLSGKPPKVPPGLKAINTNTASANKQKSRKQEKSNIKRKFKTKQTNQSEIKFLACCVFYKFMKPHRFYPSRLVKRVLKSDSQNN